MLWDGGWEESRSEDRTPKPKVPAGLVKGGSLLSLETERIDQLTGQIFSFSFSFFFFPFFF